MGVACPAGTAHRVQHSHSGSSPRMDWEHRAAKLLNYLRDHDAALPKKIKRPITPADKEQVAAARVLPDLRKALEAGVLPDSLVERLDQASERRWRASRKERDDLHAVAKAQALVEWCQTYNSGKLVMQTLDQQACKDSTHHAEHYYFLESQRKAYRGVHHRGQHPKAWAILSATFPNWHLCEQSLYPSPSTFSSSSSVQAQRSSTMEPVGFNEEEGAINTLLAVRLSSDSSSSGAGGCGSVGRKRPGPGPLSPRRPPCVRTWGDMPVRGPAAAGRTQQSGVAAAASTWPFTLPPSSEARARSARGAGSSHTPTGPGPLVPTPSEASSHVKPFLGQPEPVGIEKWGYSVGAVFSILLTPIDWRHIIRTTDPSARDTAAAAARMHVKHLGHGSWRGWVQDHSFLLLCLPCPPSYMTPERVAAIQSEIEGSDILRQRLRTALASRGRMPCLTVEFPLVAGADVRDVAGGMKALLDKLDHVMAVPRTDPSQVKEPVVPITRATATDDQPFQVVDAGIGDTGPLGLLVCSGLPVGKQGSSLHLAVRVTPERHRGGVKVLGEVKTNVQQSAWVALSFLRAHASWLDENYGLERCDPRLPAGQSFVLQMDEGIDTLNIRGSSAGAAFAARLACYCTRRLVPQLVYVTGEATISGRILPVSGYEEKIVGTANEQQRREQVRGVSGGVANVIVPAGSMEDGELVEVQDLPHTALPVTTKVCVPRWVTSRARVLAADTLFDVIGLSLLPDNDKPKVAAMPPVRPPTLAVAYALNCGNHPDFGEVQMVEFFAYPGMGQTIITTRNPYHVAEAEVALTFVRASWATLLSHWGGAAAMEPQAVDYDLHVNVPSSKSGTACACVSWAGVAAFLSVLLGRRLPDDVGFFGALMVTGHFSDVYAGGKLTHGVLRAARAAGIRKVWACSVEQPFIEAVLASSPAEEVEGLEVGYMDSAMETVDYLQTLPPTTPLPGQQQQQPH